MKKSGKVFVTILVIVFFMACFVAISGMRRDEGHATPGIWGLIVMTGTIGAIRAIWIKDDKEKDDNDAVLQK